jgi:hypothetical protein
MIDKEGEKMVKRIGIKNEMENILKWLLEMNIKLLIYLNENYFDGFGFIFVKIYLRR